MPINTLEIAQVIRSQNVVFSGTDRELCPCIYIKPNFREGGKYFKSGLNTH